MKKLIVSLAVSVILLLVFQSFLFNPSASSDVPNDAKEIFETSCYNCHSNEASNEKAIDALNFDLWDGYKKTKQISKLESICEVVKEGKMPPEKYLDKNPDAVLSDEQKKILCNWTDERSTKLMEGN
jgi:mono/diheme cytochrome c family protein